MPLLNSSFLRNRPVTKSFSDQIQILNESKTRSSFDIFLAHSYVDKEDVQALYDYLTDLNFSVYVDRIVDPHLDRSNVTKASATIIRNRLRSSKTLLLAISPDAVLSKWIPWELGYVDGHTQHCAIVPVSKDVRPPSTYEGFEYLKLYPYIKQARVDLADEMHVVESSTRFVSFNGWQRRSEQPYNRSINIDQL